ncbi:MAG: M23 family metallopeptidase [Rhizobiales bacterium]|nr:M23 family metallopeptidase [Hyphomicrobiales bacterium]
MALYSDIIDTSSKWMWSSITTGAISLLFLVGAFLGFSQSMNQHPVVFTSYNISTTIPNISKPKFEPLNVVKTAKPSTNTPSPLKIASLNRTHQINKSNRKDASFKHNPLINTEIVKSKIPAYIKGAKDAKSVKAKVNEKANSLADKQLASLITPSTKAKNVIKNTIAPSKPIPFKPVLVHIKVKKGDTLLRVLKRNGANASEAQAIINKLKPHVKVNALELGQPLTITLDQRKNKSLHPVKLIIPIGYRANKPTAILKNRVTISYDKQGELKLDLPTNLTTIAMRPGKPIRAPKYTSSKNVAGASLTRKIASLTKTNKPIPKITAAGKPKQVYYHTLSWVSKSFQKTVAAQAVPKDVQSRLLSVYNQTAKSKKIRKGDVLEMLYDQTEFASGKRKKLSKLLYVNFKANGKVYTYYRYGGSFYDKNGKNISPSSGGFMSYPVPGARLSSKYGMRKHPVLRRWKMHSGTDFAAPRGTPIYAAAAGRVLIAKWYGGAGRYIQIDHQNSYKSGYMHMTRFAKGMKPGKHVRKGQIIGYVGRTGTATGNHLHFVVSKNGKKINPMSIVGKGGSSKLTGSSLSKFKREKTRILSSLRKTKPITKVAKK